MAQPGWQHFDHDADIGVRGFGRTRAEAFEQAAVALTAAVTDPRWVRLERTIEIDCKAEDDELLLVDWLAALVYEMATRRMLFSHFEVDLDGLALHGTASGEALDVTRHQPAVEVKGVTLTALAVEQRDDGLWLAQCVIDV